MQGNLYAPSGGKRAALLNLAKSFTPPVAGAVDIIVVKQKDGSLKASPFYVCFGKYAPLRSESKIVNIYVNGRRADFHMVLGAYGQAYFVGESEVHESEDDSEDSGSEDTQPVRSKSEDNLLAHGPCFSSELEPTEHAAFAADEQKAHAPEGLPSPLGPPAAPLGRAPAGAEALPEARPRPPSRSLVATCEAELNRTVSFMLDTGEVQDALVGVGVRRNTTSLLKTVKRLWLAQAGGQRSGSDPVPRPPPPRVPGAAPPAHRGDGGRDEPGGAYQAHAGGRAASDGTSSKSESRALADTQAVHNGPNGATAAQHGGGAHKAQDEGGSGHQSGLTANSVQQKVNGGGGGNPSISRRTTHILITKKRLTATSEQLLSLQLADGENAITFASSGSDKVHANIYLVNHCSKLLVSDVDGTITRSDVLGHILPAMGLDWTQPGIVQVYRRIAQNGYQIVYLSARSIVEASTTRNFLHSLRQRGEAMPKGPIIISPHGLLPSLYREVVVRRPHEFKVACLKDICSLFPDRESPFTAGFGNRDTDEVSYEECGIPRSHIFTINMRGELRNLADSNTAWTNMTALCTSIVDELFPHHKGKRIEDMSSKDL